MTEEEVRKKMQDGWKKVSPMVAQTTNIVMDAYQEGFKTCWEMLTGQSWESFNEK